MFLIFSDLHLHLNNKTVKTFVVIYPKNECNFETRSILNNPFEHDKSQTLKIDRMPRHCLFFYVYKYMRGMLAS